MPESQTVGLIVAGVAVVAAVAVVGVVVLNKGASEKVTTIVKSGPRAWAQPWTWWGAPYYGGGGYYSGYHRAGRSGHHRHH